MFRLVIGEGLPLVGFGAAIGVAGAMALYQSLAGILLGVRARDSLTITAAVLFLSAVAVLACYLPARRATRVDPVHALRYE